MKNLKGMMILITCIVMFASCHKDTTTKPNTQASEYFPNSIGDYWEYDVYDSSSIREHPEISREYIVKVNITSIKKLVDNEDAFVWEYQYPWGTDTKYVRIVSDTVKVFDTVYSKTINDLKFPREVYIIPFHNEQRWDGKLLLIDSSHVYNALSVVTKYETFNDCFNIYHHYLAPNTEYNDNYWFKPNIGMIEIHYSHYTLAPRTIQTWQLQKFYLH